MIKILIAVAVLALLGALFGGLQVLRVSMEEPKEAPKGREEGEERPRLAAVVHCTGCGSEFTKYRYEGIQDCLAAARMPGGGPLVCDRGCLGMGTCARVCPLGAIRMERGTAVVDRDRCDGCGRCAEACPRELIALEPFRPKSHVYIPCACLEPGEDVAEFCSNGCIGCSLCAKECPREAITVEDNLARIDYEKCDGCGLCVSKCPRHLIQSEEVPEPPKPEPKPEKPPKPPKKAKEPKGGREKPPRWKRGKEEAEKPLEETPEEIVPEEPLPQAEASAEEEKAAETAGTAESPEEVSEEIPEELPKENPEEEKAPEPPVSGESDEAGEKTRISEEAFKAFEQIVAAAGEVLGEKDGEEPKEAAPAGAAGEKSE